MGNPSFWKTSLLQPQTLKSIQMLQGQSVMEVISRVIGLIGYGLTSSSWTSNTEFLEIAYQELYPIILSALLWGGKWANKGLVFQCYNEASALSKFWGVAGSEDRGGGDSSIQFINFGRVGDKVVKKWRQKIGGWRGG